MIGAPFDPATLRAVVASEAPIAAGALCTLQDEPGVITPGPDLTPLTID